MHIIQINEHYMMSSKGNLERKREQERASRVPQLTCIWMSGASGLGNLTSETKQISIQILPTIQPPNIVLLILIIITFERNNQTQTLKLRKYVFNLIRALIGKVHIYPDNHE